MAIAEKKYWYKATVGDKPKVTYLCFAASHFEARMSFESLSGKPSVTCLTWSHISALTGCLIPSDKEGSDWASGNLMFMHGDNCFVIWHNIIWGN